MEIQVKTKELCASHSCWMFVWFRAGNATMVHPFMSESPWVNTVGECRQIHTKSYSDSLFLESDFPSRLLLFHGELHAVRLALLLLKLPGQRVHLQLLSQTNLLQAVIEVWLGTRAYGRRESEDTHDLPLVFSEVHEQAEADEDDQQIHVRGLVPGLVHRVVDGLRLAPQTPVDPHGETLRLLERIHRGTV